MSDNEKSTQTEEPNFRYNAALAQDIENKWQKIWDEQGTFLGRQRQRRFEGRQGP